MSKPSERMIGVKYKTNNCGYLVVESYYSCFKVGVRFLDTGTRKFAAASKIRSGIVKDPASSLSGFGFIGHGSYNSSHKAYSVWSSMIERCYNEDRRNEHPTYKDCTVCDEWRNFQNFAAWFEDNYDYGVKGLELDKDFIKKGNRVYCPEFCSFITGYKNKSIAFAKRYKFTSPDGEEVNLYNLSEFCRENGLTASTMSALYLGKRKSHKGWTR